MTAAELRARGNAALAQGRLDEARRCYLQATVADPADPLPWLNLGFVFVETAQWPQAQESLARAISLNRPSDDFLADAHYLLGRAHQEQGAALAALSDFQAALSARPGFAEPMESTANLLLELKRYDEALEWARRCAATRPSPQADLAAAQALDKLDRPAEALQLLDSLLSREPAFATAIEGRGNMLLRMGRNEEALAAFERTVTLEGETPARLSNLAAALHRLGRFEEAVERARRALVLDPDHRNASYNLAAVLLEMLRTGEATEVLKRILRRHPDDADLQWNLAISHLLRGELAEGFAAHESRFLADSLGWRKPAPDFGRPRWTGRESLAGKSILLFAEQGLGDSIQFLRYVPGVAAQAGRVVLRLPRALSVLVADLPDNCRVVLESEPAPATDYQCPLMSLPLARGTTPGSVPANVPYLSADPARVDAWRRRLARQRASLRVGVVWSGSAAHVNDRNRSIPLELFRRVAAPGVQFVTLQPEVRMADRPALEAWTGLARFGEELRDFADTAALICALDLVVTVDTSVAHLAGALARPVWILLPHFPDWRWMLDRDDSPWYPTARLWRQPAPRDWISVLDAIRAELERVKGIEPSS